jgi:hypothetical protein
MDAASRLPANDDIALRSLAAAVAAAVQTHYASLPKTGKTQTHEHTVLAGAIVWHLSAIMHAYAPCRVVQRGAVQCGAVQVITSRAQPPKQPN